MAGSKSDYLENLVINTVIGKSTDLGGAIPSTLYIALTNSTVNDEWMPGDTGETGGGNYERYAFENSTDFWTKATTGGVTNKVPFEFTNNASAGWGTLRAFVVCDSSAGAGNSLYWGDLVAPVAVSPGNVVQFSTGSIVIGEL